VLLQAAADIGLDAGDIREALASDKDVAEGHMSVYELGRSRVGLKIPLNS